jgi:hypothetical protein
MARNDSRTLLIGGSAFALLGLGWFVLSHVVMGTSAVDAVAEALGVVLAVLVLVSLIAAVRTQGRRP